MGSLPQTVNHDANRYSILGRTQRACMLRVAMRYAQTADSERDGRAAGHNEMSENCIRRSRTFILCAVSACFGYIFSHFLNI